MKPGHTFPSTLINMQGLCLPNNTNKNENGFFCKKKLKCLIIFLYFFYLLPDFFKIFFVFSWHFGGKINLPKVYWKFWFFLSSSFFLIEFWFVSLLGWIRVQNWCKKETFVFVFAKIRKKMGTMARTRSRIKVYPTK